MINSADHSEREHDEWSASSTERNVTCAGAIALNSRVKTPEKESEAAAWGTACHQLSEKCFKTGKDADEYIGTVEKTKQRKIEVDEEVAETTQMYVDYVRNRLAEYKKHAGPNGAPAVVHHEQRFSLAALKGPFPAGGTGDTVMYFPVWKLIEIVDLKGGRGLVEAAGSYQLRSYALGAMLTNQGLNIEKVRTTIVQPRAAHKDGRIRSETLDVADLVEWTADLVAAMRRSKQACDEFDTMPFAAWSAKWLTPGKCKFCPSEGSCPALEQRALDAVGVWFDDLDKPQISNSPANDTPEKLAETLDLLDMIQDWISARRAFAHQQAEAGVVIPNYILVPKQGREKWKDEDGVEAKVKQACALLSVDKYLNPAKLKTPKQIRKALGKKENLVAGLSVTPSEGTNLVRADKTTRQAVPSAVDKFFNIETE
ncbi:DUF2800 domain-containing protein [Bradyrhizobium liaoningense]|nr:DUF2800 domain-containing protein [Bradyrhizobium liaoningense]